MGLPDPSGDCCLDQQRQLAELALQLPAPAGPAAAPAAQARPPAQRTARCAARQDASQAQPQRQQPHLAGVLSTQLHAALPPAARRALEAQPPTNLIPNGADACTHLSGQLAAASLEGAPSPTLLARLLGGSQ